MTAIVAPTEWHASLKRGDIVAFRFPHLVPGNEDPKIRPSLVLDVITRAGEPYARLAYGTTKPSKLHRGYVIPVRSERELKIASLRQATAFDGNRRMTASLRHGLFDIRKDIGTPILGRLSGASLERMNAVRARIQAEQDILKDRRQRLNHRSGGRRFISTRAQLDAISLGGKDV